MQKVLKFCAESRILPRVEKIKVQNINDAFDKRNDKEACFRYVVDMVFLKDAQ